MSPAITIVVSDRQFADFQRAAEQLSMSVDEVLSLFIGFGFGYAINEGLVGPRAHPMTKEELLKAMFDTMAQEGGGSGSV